MEKKLQHLILFPILLVLLTALIYKFVLLSNPPTKPMDIFRVVEARSGVHALVLDAIWCKETERSTWPIPRRLVEVLKTEYEFYCFFKICDRAGLIRNEIFGGESGEIGPFQFKGTTFVEVAQDFDSDGIRNPMELGDAAFSCSFYLQQLGYLEDPVEAVRKYNSSANSKYYALEVFEEAIRNGLQFDINEVRKALGLHCKPSAFFIPLPYIVI